MEVLVKRVIKEHQASMNGSSTDKSTIVTDKICTILRNIVHNKFYMPEMADQFQETLKPIFLLLAESEKITFVDDIMLIVKCMIKKTKVVSPLMWEIFDVLGSVVTKKKGQLNEILDTINQFMLFGREELSQRQNSIAIFIDII